MTSKRYGSLMSRLWLACLVGFVLLTGGAHAAPQLVSFDDREPGIVLSRHAQVLEDREGRLTLADLLDTVHAWAPHDDDTFNFGFTTSTWWVRVSLRNADAHEVQRVLDVGSTLQDAVDLYVVRSGADEAGAPRIDHIEHIATGDRRPFNARPVATRVPSLPIRFAGGEQLDVYVRLATHDGLHEAVALKLWPPSDYARAEQTENLMFGLYYGALGTVLAYNLFLFVSTRQRSFGLYVAYVSAFLFWSFTFRGYAFQYLWPDSPVFNNQVLPIAAAACYCTFSVFMISYLDTRRALPAGLHRTVVGSAIGNALCVTPALFNHYALSFAMSIPFGVTLMVSAFASGLVLLRRGSRPARFFLISFAALTVGVIVYYLRVLGLVPSNVVTENFLQFGSAAEVLLLAFGLADQMNQLKAGKLQAEREALAAQTALSTELERLVARRTKALELANLRLQESAVLDDLTGAFNQRHFGAVLGAEVARHARHGAPMALCLFNLDGFGAYNHEHGHAAGDDLLQNVAHVVRERMRRAGDQLFRVDADQFAVLLNPGHVADDTAAFVEQLRADVSTLDVTASFGLLVLSSSASAHRADEVLAAAQTLLDQARSAGRNRVVSRVWSGAPDRTRLRVVS